MYIRNAAISIFCALILAGSVNAGPIVHAYIAPQDVGLVTGAGQQFKVFGEDSDGNDITVPTPITWSSNTTAGTITSAGLFTASNVPGKYKGAVTATIPGGLTATANVEIHSNEPSNGYVIERSIGSIWAGEADSAAAVTVDANGRIYVLNASTCSVSKLDAHGRVLSQFKLQDAPSLPSQIAVDSSGNVYVTYFISSKVEKYNSSGSFVTQWGSEGTGSGQFDGPIDIAVDTTGQVYVADQGNCRVQVFNSGGTYLRQIPVVDRASDPANPSALVIGSDGYLYVALKDYDYSDWAIRKLDLQGNSLGLITAPTYASTLIDMARDTTGNFYLLSANNIVKCDANGSGLASWGRFGCDPASFGQACGIASDLADTIYVADSGKCRIMAFSINGDFVTSFDSAGNQKGQLKYPNSVTVDSQGSMYVADSGNYRVQVFDSNGGFLREQSSKLQKDSVYSYPASISCSGQNTLYTSDALGNRILAYSSSGTLLYNWALPAPTDGTGINASPCGLTYDSRGYLWSVDSYFQKIRKLDMSGNVLTTWGGEGTTDGLFENPVCSAVDSSGYVYVTDYGNDRIQKFSSSGTYVSKWGTAGSGNGQLMGPTGIFIDSSNNVFVADQNNCRIEKFSSAGSYVSQFGSEGLSKFNLKMPMGIFINAQGALYIADTYNHRIIKYVPYQTRPITVTITSPTSTDSYVSSGSSVNIAGTSSGTVTSITWANDRGGSGTCSGTSSWSASGIRLYGGPNVISVAARNSSGTVVTDSLVVYYNDVTAPSVAITSPTSNPTYTTTNATVDIGGTASDSDSLACVSWVNDRGGCGNCTGTTSWGASTIPLSVGANVITVTARDGAGNAATDKLTVTFNDVTPPIVQFTSPTGGNTFTNAQGTVDIAGTASDAGGVSSVTWTNNRGGNGYCSGTTSWSATGVKIYAGENVLTVIAKDSSGNSSTTTLTITKTTTDWVIQTVDSTGDTGRYNSMAFSAYSYSPVGISYYCDGSIKYAYSSNSSWCTGTFDSIGVVSPGSSIAIDSSSNIHVAYSADYHDGIDTDLKYAKRTGTTWTTQVVDSAGNAGRCPSIGLISSTTPVIAYYDKTNGDLKYAQKGTSTWTIQTVDSVGNVGDYPSLAVYSSLPRISYYDATNGALKYAVWSGTSWSIQTVCPASGPSSLCLDSTGKPRIAYIYGTSLMYATWDGSAWSVQIVDDSSGANYPSLAIGTDGKPQIAYYDQTGGKEKYCAWTGSCWIIQTIDNIGTSTGDVGQRSSIKLYQNQPMVSYYDYANGDLKYASCSTPVASPTVQITSPTTASTYTTTQSSINLAGIASVSTSSVSWSNNRGGSGTCSGTTSWSASGLGISYGQNIIVARVADAGGNYATTCLTVTRPDSTLPSLAITSPTTDGGWPTVSSSISIAGTASDIAGIAQVTWSITGGSSGVCQGTSNWSATVPLNPGKNSVTIRATDFCGNATEKTLIIIYSATGQLTSASAKGVADGSVVYLPRCSVTAIFADCIYVEDAGRASGIRVQLSAPINGVDIGSVIDVAGILSTLSCQERYIDGVGCISTP